MSLSAISVLLVEDEPQLRLLWLTELSKADLVVDGAASCAEAATLISCKPFDVLVLDHKLGDGTGVDVLRQARQHGCDTPAIIVSAVATREDTLDAGNLGALRFVPKPVKPKELAAVIRDVAAAAGTTSPFEHALEQLRAIGDRADNSAGHRRRSALYWLMADSRVRLAEFAVLAEALLAASSPDSDHDLSAFIAALQALCKAPAISDPRVRQALDCIAVSRARDPHILASACRMSDEGFLAALRTRPGCDVRYWVRMARVRRAFRKVISGDHLDYVAELSGFASGHQLSRDLHEVLGVTVTQIRADVRQPLSLDWCS